MFKDFGALYKGPFKFNKIDARYNKFVWRPTKWLIYNKSADCTIEYITTSYIRHYRFQFY